MSNKILWLFLFVERFLVAAKLRPFARLLVFLVRVVLSAQIPETVRIGRGTVFGYGGLGLVIHKDAVIGTDCRIGSGVVIGSRNPDIRAPRIGNSVYVASGAKILGGVNVGEGAVIGANAVVIRDVPPRSVVVGVPARVVKEAVIPETYNENFYG